MPELPDIEVYIESLRQRIVGQVLERIELKNAFLVRTAEPPLESCVGRTASDVSRLGKRIAIQLEGDLWIVLHLMIAGRLHWYELNHRGKVRPPLLALHFSNGILTLTEAGTKRRAALHVVAGKAALSDHHRGGLEVFETDFRSFVKRMTERNHTLKRALTDQSILSGIGNAYSDEILHRARLSPLLQTKQLDQAQWKSLFEATRDELREWTERLRAQAGNAFPEGVTAFRDQMNVHGRFGEACKTCGTAVQRIRYADNETNYCPHCQTEGRLLADRALSRLLKADWPKTIELLENKRRG